MRSGNNLKRWKPFAPAIGESELQKDNSGVNFSGSFHPSSENNFAFQTRPYRKNPSIVGFSFCGGAQGNNWPSEITHHSKLVINNDPHNNSHLTQEDKIRINDLQLAIEDLKAKKASRKVNSPFDLFMNKNFNSFRVKFPHLA